MATQHIYKVKGMHCASCVTLIEDKLGKVAGVSSVSVKLNQERATIDFKDAPIEAKVLSNAISAFGYTLEDADKKSGSDDGHHHGEERGQTNMALEMKFVLPMVGFSFIMMLWQVLSQNNIIPQMSENIYEFFHHLMPIFASFVLFGIGRKYIRAVWIFLKTRTANMDTLVGISTIIAFIYSFVITAFDKVLAPYIDVTSNFYDVVIVVIGLIAFGQYLEARAKKKTNEALQKLAGLTSKSALVIRDGKEIEMPIEKVAIWTFSRK